MKLTAPGLALSLLALLVVGVLSLGNAPMAAEEEAARAVAVPDGMHGFSGLLVGRLVRKDHEQGELVMHVQQVKRVWRGNKAENPRAGVGKALVLDGISGKFLDVLLLLEAGDTFEIEAKHVRGERLNFLGEGFKKVAPLADEPQAGEEKENPPAEKDGDAGGFPRGLTGFSGMLVGELVAKDVEKGELTVKVLRVKRVWRNNKADDPYAAQGKTLVVRGVFGKFLDALLLIEKGELVELEAKHTRGEQLEFPGEWLRKADRKELAESSAEEARGFDGLVRGVVADKGERIIALRVARVLRVWRNNKSENPQALVGKTVKVGPQNDLQAKFLARLREGQELSLNIRSGEGDQFVITELSQEQRAIAAGDETPGDE